MTEEAVSACREHTCYTVKRNNIAETERRNASIILQYIHCTVVPDVSDSFGFKLFRFVLRSPAVLGILPPEVLAQIDAPAMPRRKKKKGHPHSTNGNREKREELSCIVWRPCNENALRNVGIPPDAARCSCCPSQTT